MILRYYFSFIKKQFWSFCFPLVFCLPVCILMFVNIFSTVGLPYQQYQFHKNSNFICLRSTTSYSENAFLVDIVPLRGNYSEELSTENKPFYGSSMITTNYFCKNPELFSVSYFTNENLLSGSLPNYENLEKTKKNGAYPICITYEAATMSHSGIGDYLDYIEQTTVSDENGNTQETETTIHFQIVGILRPEGYSKTNSGFPTKTCALLDEAAYKSIQELAYTPTYYVFSDQYETNELADQLTMDEINAGIHRNFTEQNIFLQCGSMWFLMIALCSVTHLLMKARIATDVEVLGKMGLSKNKISLIHFLRSFTILAVSLILSVGLIHWIYLPVIKHQYYESIFTGGIALLLLFLGGIVCLADAFLLRRKH